MIYIFSFSCIQRAIVDLFCMLCNTKRIVTFKRIIIFGYVWLNTLQTNTSSQAKRDAISRVSVYVICQLSGVTARETLRRGGENFCLAQQINSATKTRKNTCTHARCTSTFISITRIPPPVVQRFLLFYLQGYIFVSKRKNAVEIKTIIFSFLSSLSCLSHFGLTN